MAIKRNQYSLRFKDRITKNRVIATTIYPEIEPADSDIYIYTKSHERLDLLAYQYYGTQRLWLVLAQANHIGNGSFVIEPGTRLRIPQDMTKILNDLEKINIER